MLQTDSKNDQGHHYIVIMAGGSGTRLWPLSRKSKPKQFQSFVSEKTMIEETYDRVKNLVPEGHIFVSTTEEYQRLVLEKIPEIKQENIIVEPEARNTAPAIALVSTTVGILDPEAIIATIASDHAIENEDEFRATIETALNVVSSYPDKLVTIGINPTKADTGLGYIRMGQEFTTVNSKRIFTVDAFKEKPDYATAEQYLASWEYLWNAGYFIFATRTFDTWLAELAPALHETMTKISVAGTSGTLDRATLITLYHETTSEPIEPLIVEKLAPKHRLVIPAPLKWSDVGSWSTLYEFLAEKSGNHSVIHGEHIDLGSSNLLIQGHDRLIATIGIKDLIVVDTPDALLIAHRDQASTEIKKLIEQIKSAGRTKIL